MAFHQHRKVPFQEGQIRVGRVTQVDTNKRIAATVTYADLGYQTNFIPCLQKNTLGAQEFYVPEPGETVWVLHPANSPETGLILGSVYTVKNPPPYNTKNKRGIVFADGGYVIYDVTGAGTYAIHVPGRVQLTSGGDTDVTTGANLNAKVTGDVVATVSGALTATISGTANITAPNIELHGNTKVFGTLRCTGFFTADVGGTTLSSHITNADGAGGGS
jgi:phage baseplate assembly protein V